MKICRTLLPVIIFIPLALRAAESQADLDFRALQALAVPRATSSGLLTEAQMDTERRQQIALLVRASEKAKEFYEKNASHPKAAEAKKIEVESLLRAARDGATEHEVKALRLARDYRSSPANSSRQRYEIAVTVKQLEGLKKNYGESKVDTLAAYEKTAMDLYGEFPNEPAVYDLFLGVARTADAAKARSVANQILLMPAPVLVKDEARNIIARLDMPGKPFEAEWNDDQDRFYKVQDYKGKIIVFYVWAAWAASADADAKVRTLVPSNAILVSVNLDPDSVKGKAAKSKAAIGGIAHYDSRGLNGPLAKQLRATKVPGVYVVNAKGVFVGEGGPEALASLLETAGKP